MYHKHVLPPSQWEEWSLIYMSGSCHLISYGLCSQHKPDSFTRRRLSHRQLRSVRGTQFFFGALGWQGWNPIKLMCDPLQPDGWQSLMASTFNQLVAGPTATQNLPFSSLVVAVTVARTHCVCPMRDGQAELAWMAGYIARCFRCPNAVIHHANQAHHRATSFIETNALPICRLPP